MSWPSLENILPELKTGFLKGHFVIEGCVDPTEPLHDKGPCCDYTSYSTLPEPYRVLHVTAITANA
jgi:3-polyprenyl-4-hydroxybenzoate decarboxylase